MIFVTTGTQLPFPRLMAAMDEIAAATDERVIAQVGPDAAPRRHLEVRQRLDPREFDALFREARVVVAHAGIGSILSAQAQGRPLILFPRRFDQGEHRNDHQQATARAVEGRRGIYVAWSVEDLRKLLKQQDLNAADAAPGPDLAPLVDHIRAFINR